MNSSLSKMSSSLTGMWVNFFTAAGIPSEVGAGYALTFTENRIQNDMLLDLNKEYLRDMGISRMGDVIAILRHAKQVHESIARDRVLGATNKVPVAAVTGRTTSAQPSSPASRILEHYTRNPQVKEPPPVVAQLKRKSNDNEPQADFQIKKSRLIRFASNQNVSTNEGVSSKQTVFARLGNSEAKVAVTTNAAAKPVFARLGSKSDTPPTKANQAIPMDKDALKYEGILKSPPPSKKTVTITTTKNNVRRIACTMRADEQPVSVKEKLNLAKQKSVKFSNFVQYKEIEANQTKAVVKPKFTPVFNKPERRLSMPTEQVNNGVKARLGAKNANSLTITKNIFNRLGV